MKPLQKSLWFIFSVSLNALGNSFMIVGNLGSAPWTSAAQNMETVLPLSIGVCIILLNVVSFLVCLLLKTRFKVIVVVMSMALAFIFGMFIDLFVQLHHLIYVPDSLAIRVVYLLVGINFVAIAVSIYFQVGSVYLPFDYLLQAFARLKKSYTAGTIICMSIPLSISIVIILFRHHIVGVGIGTLLFVFGLGYLIDMYNKKIVFERTETQEES